MTQRTIGIGETSSFRYIGIEPPLDKADSTQIAADIILPEWVVWKQVYHTHQTYTDGPTYTEFGFDVGDALDCIGEEIVNTDTVQVAEQIAALLRSRGDIVTVLNDVFATDFQTPIFGSRWYEMGEFTESLKSTGIE